MKSLKRLLGHCYLWAFGWKPEGERPSADAFVLIAAPHTSNWDLPFMLALSYVYDVPIRWAGKHSLFRFPQGLAMRALGGMPIVRHERRNYVQSLAALFETHPHLVLTVPAEGTRSYRDHWKSGFYHVAREAGVPFVCGYLDYGRKRGGFGPAIVPSGDIAADMDKVRAFYEDKAGKFPEKFGPVRLRDEGQAGDDEGSGEAVA